MENYSLKSVFNFRVFVSFLCSVSILWMLLSIYCDISAGRSFILSVIYIADIISGVIIFQSFIRYLKKIGVRFQIIMIIFMQVISLFSLFLISWLFGIISLKQFGEIIPLITVFGLMFFGLLVLWNKNQQIAEDKENEEDIVDVEINDVENEKETNILIQPNQQEIKKIENERISVKQGAEIHIIKTDEIFYIEAYGDYVLIYTEKSKFIKEQTMSYLEKNLPSQFIRIHRSHIVNADYMIRLELFGKETYNIRLKNGVSLKASKTGYKLLKEKLNL